MASFACCFKRISSVCDLTNDTHLLPETFAIGTIVQVVILAPRKYARATSTPLQRVKYA